MLTFPKMFSQSFSGDRIAYLEKVLKSAQYLGIPPRQLEQFSSLLTENICRYFRKNSNYLHIETIHGTKIPLWQRDQDAFPNTVP